MIAIPAIDLRDGACVQLVGGDYQAERVRLPDPLAVADRWREAGFARLHVVDLDAATGRGDNWSVVERLLERAGMRVQLGGGMGDDARIARAFAAGADRVVVGTRAVSDSDWLGDVVGRHPGRVVVAADVRGREIVVRGWTGGSGLDVVDVARRTGELPLGGLLVTAVHREGQLAGPDLGLVGDVAGATPHPVIASGGIRSADDLRALERAGAAAAVIGMALYVGAMEPERIAREFTG
jgi:phosphoribosylformimino-5-aminoimidazole carboxamide ribotide isomerase